MAKRTKKQEPTIEELCEVTATNLQTLYLSLLRKGFSCDQAFELVKMILQKGL